MRPCLEILMKLPILLPGPHSWHMTLVSVSRRSRKEIRKGRAQAPTTTSSPLPATALMYCYYGWPLCISQGCSLCCCPRSHLFIPRKDILPVTLFLLPGSQHPRQPTLTSALGARLLCFPSHTESGVNCVANRILQKWWCVISDVKS